MALLSRVFLGEHIRGRVSLAIGCAVAGIAMLALAKESGGAAAAPPPIWAMRCCSVRCCARPATSSSASGSTGSVSPRRISALINLWGLALVTPFGLWQAWGFDFGAVAAPTWGLLLFYALAASMFTVWLWMMGLRHVPAPQAGVFTVMLPISAALVGVLFLGEGFGPLHLVAFALAVAGLLLATWPARRRQARRIGAQRLTTASSPAPGRQAARPAAPGAPGWRLRPAAGDFSR